MRICGKRPTAKEVADMGTLAVIQQLMFYAAANDARPTRTAEAALRLLVAEIAGRCRCSLLDSELDHIIEHY